MKISIASITASSIILVISSLCLLLVVLSFTRIYINSDEENTAHQIQLTKQHIQEAKAHITKLEVERDSLLSPYALRKTAEKIGMNMATPGQIRRISLKDGNPAKTKKIGFESGTLQAAK